MKQYINITFGVVLSLTLFTSCESLLEVSPEEVLLSDNYLGDSEVDARSALFGVLSQLQEVAGQYVVLGEMRGDLVNITADAADDLRQINDHNVSPDNSFADPTTLFSIINNCNFALEGIDTESYENLLLDDYASILRIRTWAQMQILINHGELPYITKPIKTNGDLDEEYPLLNFDQALNQLIENLQEVTEVENVTKYENSLGFNIFSMIPDQNILLGDLNLWKGNHVQAATHYKLFLDDNVDGSKYNLTTTDGVVVRESGDSYNWTSRWLNIFREGIRTSEIINYVSFSEQYRQPNSNISLATNQFKPSRTIILKWGEQALGFEGKPVILGVDTRTANSYSGQDDLARISKYQFDYFTWNRTAKIYLRYAEAINYAGYPQHALTIVNGIFNNPDVDPGDALIFNNPEGFLNFDKDIYYTTDSNDIPTSGNLGVRGRVGMAPVSIDEDLGKGEAMDAVGALILEESALELAFEGNRWEDLLRFSRRANDGSILADAVYDKFETSGNIAQGNEVRAKLMNPSNWFLPLVVPTNFVSK